MRIKVNFGKSEKLIRMPLNKEVNGFVNRILGENNEYHGKFSRYNISSMLGYTTVGTEGIRFPNGGYFYVSSDDDEFVERFVFGLINKGRGLGIMDMPYLYYEMCDFKLNRSFDLVRTISPITIRVDNKAVTFDNPIFTSKLLDVSKKKLIHCGSSESDVDTLSIELFHPENAKTKMVKIGNAKVVCNFVMFVVRGKKNVRKALYETGIGRSTGFGFGAVSLNEKVL